MAEHPNYLKTLSQDLSAGLVVFLVALPLCLGIALASGAPMASGIVAGVVGGILVAWLSGSHTSISGPAAGLTAIVASQIESLGSIDAFLVAVVLAGAMQVALGLLKAGSLAAFFPSSVIKGLLAAIGIILILKQIPHLFGHDPDWFGDMSFQQIDGLNTFTELLATRFDVHPGAMVIGLTCLLLLAVWDRTPLAKSPVPAPLVVVVVGVLMALGFRELGGIWEIGVSHLVQVPNSGPLPVRLGTLPSPDFSALGNPQILTAALTVAVVASLETLLNLEAVDKLDPQRRVSPPNRELLAQGVGNMTSGMLGGLPITSVVVRSSVGISAGGMTRMACFVHGVLLLVLVLFLPDLLNLIPFSCLAAILIVTGFKLAKPSLFKTMWDEGRNQFLPFVATIGAIVMTDLLVGIVIGMLAAMAFILRSNMRSPLRKISERHVGGDVLRIEFANQLTFLNRAMLLETFNGIPHQSQVVLDGRNTLYIDPDIIDLINEFENEIAPAHQIEVSRIGFMDDYDLEDRITYVDVTTREIQDRATPAQVLRVLAEGNERFVGGQQIMRDTRRQVDMTSAGQHPLAVVLACMDSRVATEMIFDLGLGDLFSVRVAGNVASEQELGSLEYGCGIAGAKLLLVLGHTRCGAVTATINQVAEGGGARQAGGFENLAILTGRIAESVHAETETTSERNGNNEAFVGRVTLLNVRRTMREIRDKSETLRGLIEEGKILLVGAIYDVETGRVEFLDPD